MPTPTVHELDDRFDERNLFLQVALAAVSLCRRFETLAADQAAARPRAAATQASHRGGDLPVLYLVLGLLSFSRHTMSYLNVVRQKTRVRGAHQHAGSRRRHPTTNPRRLLA